MINQIREGFDKAPDKIQYLNDIKLELSKLSKMNHNPVDCVIWVKIEEVQANDYNPNSVAGVEMQLLSTSILHDGYTQPIVTIRDESIKKYVIIDGFHRYFSCLNNPKIMELNKGYLPIVVLKKDINDRMASTVRHNRARGKHSVSGMSSMVFKMLENGWADAQICNELGMEADELVRLKHITGFSKLFNDTEYRKAWETQSQMKIRSEQSKSSAKAE